MRTLYILIAVMALIFVLPVMKKFSSGHDINGSSRKAIYSSAKKVKRYLPADQRVVFDFAFGVVEEIKTAEGGEEAFFSAVNGLAPEQVIELAKQEVTKKIAARDPKFSQYESWDDMVKKLTAATEPLRNLPERQQGPH